MASRRALVAPLLLLLVPALSQQYAAENQQHQLMSEYAEACPEYTLYSQFQQ